MNDSNTNLPPAPTPASTTKPKLKSENAANLAQYFKDNGLSDELKKVEKRLPQAVREIVFSRVETELEKFITQDPAMLQVKSDVRILAGIDDPVLIQGPTGTGKEILANALHGNREGKFVAINCAGLPAALIESELFGHAKGSFTGADKEKIGLCRTADDGTLFLDEVAELPLSTQATLLRVLQENTIRKVGSNVTERINCRFVCATCKKLDHLVETGKFREDLFYRMNTFELHTTGLAYRPNDIILLLKQLDTEDKFIEHVGKLYSLPLHGNVRELQQIVKRFLVLGKTPF